jgi:hypothetical protein
MRSTLVDLTEKLQVQKGSPKLREGVVRRDQHVRIRNSLQSHTSRISDLQTFIVTFPFGQ